MRIVLDTNVLISGLFFGGPPFKILEAWRDGHRFIQVTKKELLNWPELNIASSTASEAAARGRQIVEKQGVKLLDEDID